jgi:uncharacterized protein (DUF924 family)
MMSQEIVEFWFSDEVRKLWYRSTPEFDQLLIDRYEETWQQASRGELDHWMDTATGCLALAIILDQLPLNMYRNSAMSFSTEAKSREVAKIAIERGFDKSLPAEQLSFLYMPFMHSESIEDQDLALQLFAQPGLESNFRFAHHHRAIVEKFGRFPHRNEALGRDSSGAEIEYLNSKEAFTG